MMRSGKPPRLGPAAGSSVQGETKALVTQLHQSQNYIIDRKHRNYIPVTALGIYNLSKTGKLNVINNNPRPR